MCPKNAKKNRRKKKKKQKSKTSLFFYLSYLSINLCRSTFIWTVSPITKYQMNNGYILISCLTMNHNIQSIVVIYWYKMHNILVEVVDWHHLLMSPFYGIKLYYANLLNNYYLLTGKIMRQLTHSQCKDYESIIIIWNFRTRPS